MEVSNSEKYLKEIIDLLRAHESRYEEYFQKTKELYERQKLESKANSWAIFISYVTIVAIGVFIGGLMVSAIR